MIAHYGPMGDFFTAVVPQFAWHSPAVKHMLVALSMTHEKFEKGVASVSLDMTSRAVSHYIKAITDIRKNSPPILFILVASLVGWCLEIMQNNYPAAVVHLRASLALLQNPENTQQWRYAYEIIQKSIKPTSLLAEGLTSLVLRRDITTDEVDPVYRDHISAPFVGPQFSSITEARLAMCDHIKEIVAWSNHGGDETTILDTEKSVSGWFDSVRRWDQESIASTNLIALLLMFNLAMALFPSSHVAGFSYSINPATIDFVVERSVVLVGIHKMAKEEDPDLKETLTLVLGFVVRLFPDSKSHRRALLLLNQLSSSR